MKTKPPPLAKTTRPQIAGALLRTRLFRQLDRSPRPITWICGPPGSGKTTLVATYIEARKVPVLWYQVDEGDADAATFFYYMAQALRQLTPHRRKPLPVPTTDNWPQLSVFTRRYFRELYGRLPRPSMVVLDNYHDVPEHSRFHEVIGDGLGEAPEGIRIVVLSREEAPPSLARLRASDAIESIGWIDLRLRVEESRRIVRLRSRKALADKTLRALHEKVGGWAAGLTLMLEAGSDELVPESLTDATPEVIFQYFANEVFRKEEPATQRFLLETAFLKTFTARMAAELTGASHAGRLLSTLARRQYFVDQRAHPGRVFQYHPLFREYLLRHARETLDAEALRRAQHRAAALLCASRQHESAASLFRAMSDWDGLIQIILDRAQALWDSGRMLTLQEWLGSLPGERVERDGWLQYWSGMCSMPFDLEQSRARFERSFILFQGRDEPGGELQSILGVSATFLFEWAGFAPLDQWIERLDRFSASHPNVVSGPIADRVVTTMFGALTFRQPHHVDIRRWAERALAVVRTSADANRRMFTGFMLTMYHLWMGEVGKAVMVTETLRRSRRPSEIQPLASLAQRVAEAYCHWCVAEPEACAKTVAAGLATARSSGVRTLDVALLGQGVCGALTGGDLGAARLLLEQMAGALDAKRILHQSHYHSLAGWEAFLRGDRASAHQHAEQALQLAVEAGMPIAQMINHIALAQVLHQQGSGDEAVRHLEAARRINVGVGSLSIEFMRLLAAADLAFGERQEDDGITLLRAALELGRRQGYVNTMWWSPARMASLCVKALQAGIEVEYARELVHKRGLTPEHPPLHVSGWPWPLRVFTLGGFALEGERTAARSSRKSQQRPLALLQAIIALGGQNVNEELLGDALWPDADGDAAHQAMTVTLHRLRRLLGYEKAIVVEGGKVSLDPRYWWVDVWAFDRLLEQGEAAVREGDRATARGRIEEAVGLYRGPFLRQRGASWALSLSERLHRKFVRAVAILGDSWEQEGDWQAALCCYERGLEIDDLAEEFYRRQMSCYQRLGRLAEAAIVYQRCRETLSASLGVTPSPETQALHASLRD